MALNKYPLNESVQSLNKQTLRPQQIETAWWTDRWSMDGKQRVQFRELKKPLAQPQFLKDQEVVIAAWTDAKQWTQIQQPYWLVQKPYKALHGLPSLPHVYLHIYYNNDNTYSACRAKWRRGSQTMRKALRLLRESLAQRNCNCQHVPALRHKRRWSSSRLIPFQHPSQAYQKQTRALVNGCR